MKYIRILQEKIEKQLFPGGNKQSAIVLYGPRQVGKTTLVQDILARYPDGAEYYNGDYLDVQEKFAYERTAQLGSLLRGVKLLVLDEAQRITDIGLVLKIIVDTYPSVQVIATGSSSFDLANRTAESLTGRKWEHTLYPLSFEELTNGMNALERDRLIPRLLRFGSYPIVASASDRDAETYLRELTGSYLLKDLLMLHDVRKPEILLTLLRLLAFQIGSEVSYHELAQQVGVDQTVIQRYLYLLEQAFVIVRLPALRRNMRSEVSRSRKIYFTDLGVRNTLIQNLNPLELRNDVGALWENFCIVERIKYRTYHGQFTNMFFWRTHDQKEIDLVEEYGGQLHAYEFAWGDGKRKKRPTAFFDAYPGSTFSVVTPKNVMEFFSASSSSYFSPRP